MNNLPSMNLAHKFMLNLLNSVENVKQDDLTEGRINWKFLFVWTMSLSSSKKETVLNEIKIVHL